MKLLNFDVYNLEKLFFFSTIFSGFWGTAIFSVSLGQITFFPYRFFLVFLWFFFALQVLYRKKLNLSEIRIKWYLVFFCVWIAYAVLTLAWAKNSVAAIEDVVFLAMAISVIFFTVYYSQKERDFEILYWLWVIVFAGFVILGFWEHLTGNHLAVSNLFQETSPRLMYVPTGVFYNQNNYSMALTLCIPFASGLARYEEQLMTRLFGLVLVLSASYLIIITGSSANILALFLEIVFFWLVLLQPKDKAKFGLVLVGLVILSTLIVPSFFQTLQNEVYSNLNSLVVQTKRMRGSIKVRFNLVRNGLLFLRSTWGFGVGSGNAEYWMENFGQFSTEGILNPHNWWLENFINYGIFVSFGYMTVYFGLLRNLWKGWMSSVHSERKKIPEALLLSLIGFFIASLSPSSIMGFKPQWFLFAFALAFLNFHRKGRISEP